jgi:hypothetical protein
MDNKHFHTMPLNEWENVYKPAKKTIDRLEKELEKEKENKIITVMLEFMNGRYEGRSFHIGDHKQYPVYNIEPSAIIAKARGNTELLTVYPQVVEYALQVFNASIVDHHDNWHHSLRGIQILTLETYNEMLNTMGDTHYKVVKQIEQLKTKEKAILRMPKWLIKLFNWRTYEY